MKRIIKCFACLFITVALAVGIFITVKLNKKFPDEIVYGEYMQTFSDNGMYFINNNRLCFIDNATGQKVVVCNRANCEHKDKACNAYIPGIGVNMLVYDGYVYISSCESEILHGEDGHITKEGISTLIRLKIDGSHRREIYSADSGAVLSMMAVGDMLYFTAYTDYGEYKANVWHNDNALYAYNIRWGKLKCIKKYAFTEEEDSAGAEIIGISDKGTLYIDYGYTNGDAATGIVTNRIEEVNIKTRDVVLLRTFEDAYPKFFADKNKKYLQTSDFETDVLTMRECDDRFGDGKELFTAKNARVDWLGGYMHVVSSDYLKALYDYEEDRWYIAKTSFAQEGTYISDIKKVDRGKNIVYIDATDYTGYKPGDLLPGDISNKAVRDWSVFLEENFIPYEDLTGEQLESLTWIDIK